MLSTSATKLQWDGHIELKTNEKKNNNKYMLCLLLFCCEIALNLSVYRAMRECENDTKLSTVGKLKSSNVSCATVAQLRNVNKYIEPCSHFLNLLIIFSCDFVFYAWRWKIRRCICITLFLLLLFILSDSFNSCIWMRVLWANESNFEGKPWTE